MAEPLWYYRNTLMLLDAMKAHKVKILIYSSTCATSGEPKRDANHRRYTADPKGRL
jgi:UDP-glucose 4-epimerase